MYLSVINILWLFFVYLKFIYVEYINVIYVYKWMLKIWIFILGVNSLLGFFYYEGLFFFFFLGWGVEISFRFD